MPKLKTIREKIEDIITEFYWKILRKSGVFNYWAKRFLTELMFDLELHRDIEQEEIENKYRDKLKTIETNEK